jgi:5-methylcytosine-specific restriction endonuclease McrA
MKKKKSERRKLTEENIYMAKRIAKIRDNFTCQHCWKKVSWLDCHWSHIIPVSADWRLSYDSENIKVLCYRCHFHRWHKNPVEAWPWFKKKFPKRDKYLKEKHKNKPMWSIWILFVRERNTELKIELKKALDNNK